MCACLCVVHVYVCVCVRVSSVGMNVGGNANEGVGGYSTAQPHTRNIPPHLQPSICYVTCYPLLYGRHTAAVAIAVAAATPTKLIVAVFPPDVT